MTTQIDHAALLASIKDQQSNAPLSILSLTEPILSSRQQEQQESLQADKNGDTSISNLTATANDSSSATQQGANQNSNNLTPTTLAADLDHYRSLFSKLRFSYLEQVTKEKYLRSIVGDPPVLVSHEDNTALETKLVGMKSELKTKKRKTDDLVGEIEGVAREVATRYEDVEAKSKELATLPGEMEELERQVEELRRRLRDREDEMDLDHHHYDNHDGDADFPRMRLGMRETEDLLEEQRRRTREVEAEIEALQDDMPGKIRECERAERELEELESKRNEVTKIAREVKRIKEEGGRDMLEEQGRWYKSSEIVLNGLLAT